MPNPAELPFVLRVEPIEPERRDSTDLYLPTAAGPSPLVVLVHGGPFTADRLPVPRDWPVFAGYGAAVAARGAVGAVVSHRLHAPSDYPLAARDVADAVDAVDAVRRDPRVDADRVALWFFSGGGLLLASWLRDSPSSSTGVRPVPAVCGASPDSYRSQVDGSCPVVGRGGPG